MTVAAAAVTPWAPGVSTSTSSAGPVVRRGDLLIAVPASGSIVAQRSVDITAPISGDPHFFKVARLAPEGTVVEAGQTVMELDSQEVADKLRDYQAEVETMREELAKRILEYQIQVRDLRVRIEQSRVKRETMALKQEILPHLISAQERRQHDLELQQATQEHLLLQDKLAATERMMSSETGVLDRNLANVRQRLDKARALQAASVVKAPIAGTIVYKVMADGAKRKVGEQTCHHEIILQIPDLLTLYLQAAVDERYAGLVRAGQPVRITVDALPDETLSGTITQAGTVLHAKRDSPIKVVDIAVALSRVSGRLSPGMTASARIEIDHVRQALLVPLASVAEREGRVFVRVAGPGGSTEERTIRAGRRNEALVEVLEGVREGETLAPD